MTKGDLSSYGSPGSTGDHDHDHQHMDEYKGGQTDSGTVVGDYSIKMKTTFPLKFWFLKAFFKLQVNKKKL